MNPVLDEFANSLLCADFRVARFSDHVFFCGGNRGRDSGTEASLSIANYLTNKLLELFRGGRSGTALGGEHSSARGYISKRMSDENHPLVHRMVFAEDVTDWFREDHYKDLQLFERHLSEVASLVFLIPESEGSFTELGAFANDKIIKRKLFVLNNELADPKNTSYISLGPIAHLRNNFHKHVSVYAWRNGHLAEDLDSNWHNALEDLIDFENSLPKNPAFSSHNNGHISLLIADLIMLFGALLEGEVRHLLEIILGKDNGIKVRQHLFMLEKLEVISIKRSGHYKFYISNFTEPFITYAFKTGTDMKLKDRGTMSFDAFEWFQKNDSHRLTAIKQIMVADHG